MSHESSESFRLSRRLFIFKIRRVKVVDFTNLLKTLKWKHIIIGLKNVFVRCYVIIYRYTRIYVSINVIRVSLLASHFRGA